MRLISGLLVALCVSVLILDLNGSVHSMISGPAPGTGAKMMSVEPDKKKSYVSDLLQAAKVTFGWETAKEENKTNLQKLVDQRRRETAPVKTQLGF